MADTQSVVVGAVSGIALTLLTMLVISVQPEDTHYCESLSLTMHCDRVSASGLRCYPLANTTKGYKDCSTSWVLIDRTEPVKTLEVSNRYLCSPDSCNPI